MGRSRRKLKKNWNKVRVGLPKKKPGVFKPAFTVPEKLLEAAPASEEEKREWDEAGTVIRNYRSFGVVNNPNLLGVRARTPQIVQSSALQLPPGSPEDPSALEAFDSGSDVEMDGKKRKDGKAAPLRGLTTIQRLHIGRLLEKYGDDYQAMFKDTKLSSMQHSVASLKKALSKVPCSQEVLCKCEVTWSHSPLAGFVRLLLVGCLQGFVVLWFRRILYFVAYNICSLKRFCSQTAVNILIYFFSYL